MTVLSCLLLCVLPATSEPLFQNTVSTDLIIYTKCLKGDISSAFNMSFITCVEMCAEQGSEIQSQVVTTDP